MISANLPHLHARLASFDCGNISCDTTADDDEVFLLYLSIRIHSSVQLLVVATNRLPLHTLVSVDPESKCSGRRRCLGLLGVSPLAMREERRIGAW